MVAEKDLPIYSAASLMRDSYSELFYSSLKSCIFKSPVASLEA